MNSAELLGQAQTHLVRLDNDHQLHRGVIAPWRSLQQAAAADGINLQLASSFRSFERQLAIWNGKCSGRRLLRNRQNNPVTAAHLTPDELLDTVLAWSALPGASRHHWGCDVDVYAPEMLQGQRLQLEPWEYQPAGPMAELGLWLDENLAAQGFFRPYASDRGGVAIEPWHISYREIAVPALSQLTPGLLVDALQATDIALKETILTRLTSIYQHYIVNINHRE